MPLAQRVLEPEVMDDPAIETPLLEGALRGLTTINRLSRSANIVWPTVAQLARRLKRNELRVLDIATGAGDVPLALWRKALRRGIDLRIDAVDMNDRSLRFAQRQAERMNAPISFRRLNVLEDELPSGYDVVMCSLFLHHLATDDARQLLANMAKATSHLVLVSDLRRHWWGLTLAHVASRVLTRSSVVRVDAIRSVRAAFTIDEVRSLAHEVGLSGVTVSRRWPCRYLLSWTKS